MALPPGFNFANEDDFNQNYVIPLLHRLGYAVVANYHGAVQLAKDLVFAEIDRFGHVRFHAVQTKYVPSVSLTAVQSLIQEMLSRRSTIRFGTHKQVLMNGLVRFMRLTVEQLATLLEITISIHCSLDTAVMSGYYRARIYRF